MPHQIQKQLDVWLEIMILQKYAAIDKHHYPASKENASLINADEAKQRLQGLIRRTCRSFDLCPPEDQADETKKRFNDWHQEMLVLFCTRSYARMLCSLCPMSLGLEDMITREGAAPCILLQDARLFSFEPFGCVILSTNYWQEGFLIEHIFRQHGIQAVSDFIDIKTSFNR